MKYDQQMNDLNHNNSLAHKDDGSTMKNGRKNKDREKECLAKKIGFDYCMC